MERTILVAHGQVCLKSLPIAKEKKEKDYKEKDYRASTLKVKYELLLP